MCIRDRDRDGHPFVTPKITQDTLSLHRKNALLLIKNQLVNAAVKLSVSAIYNPIPFILLETIEKKSKELGLSGEEALKRNPYEPWRQYLNLLLAKVEKMCIRDRIEVVSGLEPLSPTCNVIVMDQYERKELFIKLKEQYVVTTSDDGVCYIDSASIRIINGFADTTVEETISNGCLLYTSRCV